MIKSRNSVSYMQGGILRKDLLCVDSINNANSRKSIATKLIVTFIVVSLVILTIFLSPNKKIKENYLEMGFFDVSSLSLRPEKIALIILLIVDIGLLIAIFAARKREKRMARMIWLRQKKLRETKEKKEAKK